MKHEEYIQQIENFYESSLFISPKSEKKIDILLQPELLYQNIMTQSEEHAKPLHKYINIFLKSDFSSSNPKIRNQLISSYWLFLEDILKQNTFNNEVSIKLLLRYGIIVSSAISKKILQLIINNDIFAPPKVSVYYLDEWLEGVIKGDISQSLLDNIKGPSKELLALNEKQKINQIQKLQDSSLQKAQNISQENKILLHQILSISNEIESSMKENELGYIPPMKESTISELYACIQAIQTMRMKNNQLQEVQKNIEKI